ncbi:hypothetical protein FIBSPDRAFT_917554 [Athelia psychrophila]|uniref:EF-hand domain-containing protein n=1 Tax=Athelia psychrophila TaxID=1759441 RepID=A0A166S1L8_9AGAM|nr:hypothetical protein FIBSPDRAFT_917554 [Fibularhizoctonia sp. CBS 109695]
MKTIASLSLLLLPVVLAHGGHGEAGEPVDPNANYAQRHMASEHHIDSFDAQSFFQLHDLNSDGIWDREEVEAIYGVHHIYSQKKSKDDAAHQEKADKITTTIFDLMDKNHDGKITPEEFELAGLDSLPDFKDLGAEGHHYDIESEFFLHHEEEYHSTPETQTDESYNHAEDLEHFAAHESIELKEAEKEAKFQGITVEEALASHDPDAVPPPPAAENNEGAGAGEPATPILPPNPKVTRVTPPEKQDPAIRYKDAASEKDKTSEWGVGDEGYKPPSSPSDKMRKNVPYKYKFRRNWGDF